jgi:hypothetical protein
MAYGRRLGADHHIPSPPPQARADYPLSMNIQSHASYVLGFETYKTGEKMGRAIPMIGTIPAITIIHLNYEDRFINISDR